MNEQELRQQIAKDIIARMWNPTGKHPYPNCICHKECEGIRCQEAYDCICSDLDGGLEVAALIALGNKLNINGLNTTMHTAIHGPYDDLACRECTDALFTLEERGWPIYISYPCPGSLEETRDREQL